MKAFLNTHTCIGKLDVNDTNVKIQLHRKNEFPSATTLQLEYTQHDWSSNLVIVILILLYITRWAVQTAPIPSTRMSATAVALLSLLFIAMLIGVGVAATYLWFNTRKKEIVERRSRRMSVSMQYSFVVHSLLLLLFYFCIFDRIHSVTTMHRLKYYLLIKKKNCVWQCQPHQVHHWQSCYQTMLVSSHTRT